MVTGNLQKKTEWNKICRRCDKNFLTNHKFGRYCSDCMKKDAPKVLSTQQYEERRHNRIRLQREKDMYENLINYKDIATKMIDAEKPFIKNLGRLILSGNIDEVVKIKDSFPEEWNFYAKLAYEKAKKLKARNKK